MNITPSGGGGRNNSREEQPPGGGPFSPSTEAGEGLLFPHNRTPNDRLQLGPAAVGRPHPMEMSSSGQGGPPASGRNIRAVLLSTNESPGTGFGSTISPPSASATHALGAPSAVAAAATSVGLYRSSPNSGNNSFRIPSSSRASRGRFFKSSQRIFRSLANRCSFLPVNCIFLLIFCSSIFVLFLFLTEAGAKLHGKIIDMSVKFKPPFLADNHPYAAGQLSPSDLEIAFVQRINESGRLAPLKAKSNEALHGGDHGDDDDNDDGDEKSYYEVVSRILVRSDGSVALNGTFDSAVERSNGQQVNDRHSIVVDVQGNVLRVNPRRLPEPSGAQGKAVNAIDPSKVDLSVPASNVAEGLARKFVSNVHFDRVDAEHMHGQYGVGFDGQPLWRPRPIKFKLTREQKVAAHTGYCFDTRTSQSLALDRSIPDYNGRKCRAVDYDNTNLLPASVIFVFYNEDLSVLLRSFHSVLNRTPPHLLREVILVDDYSNTTTHSWLGEDLERYLQFVPKVVLRRLPTRHGLMRARMAGVEWATGEIVVFLDSHIECSPRWLEPMLARVTANPTTIVVPFIHTINAETFAFERGALNVLGFSWSLGQSHPPRPESDFEPMDSPVMAGGLFAANKSWFNKLGGYDPEMQLYGAEEMEIGFKTWTCGGRLEALPCSRVGHVFRTPTYWPHQVYKVPGEIIHRNKLRTAMIWMDDYAKIVQIATPRLPAGMDLGDMSLMKNLRKKLNCKPFQWYLDTVFPDLRTPDMIGAQAGSYFIKRDNMCLDSLGNEREDQPVGLYGCHGMWGSQAILHEGSGAILIGPMLVHCARPNSDFWSKLPRKKGDNNEDDGERFFGISKLFTSPRENHQIVRSTECDDARWLYDNDEGNSDVGQFFFLGPYSARDEDRRRIHEIAKEKINLCLAAHKSSQHDYKLVITKCNKKDPLQLWGFKQMPDLL